MKTLRSRNHRFTTVQRDSACRATPLHGLIFFMALASMMLLCLVAFPQEKPDGLSLIDREQYRSGISVLRSEFDAQPSAIRAYRLGCGLLETGDPKGATIVFDKGIELDAKSGLNYAGKARAMIKDGNMQQAAVLLDRALEVSKSKDVAVLNAVARACLDNPEWQVRAMDLLAKAESIGPNAETSILLGDAFLQQGNGGAAISHYEHAATFDARNATPHYKIGMVYVRSANRQAALESFETAVRIDPTYTKAWGEAAGLAYLMKNGNAAVSAQEKYLALTESKDQGLVRLAFYYFMAKDFPKAAETFDHSWQKGTLKEAGVRYFAIALSETEEYDKARQLFDVYFRQSKPGQVDAGDYALYGKVLIKLERDSLALVAFDQSLSIDPNQMAVKQMKAETLFKNKRYAEAARSYTDLLGIKQKASSQDLYSLGRAQYYTEDYRGADSTFRQLIALQPGMSAGYLWAARSNAHLDPESEKGMALPFYEKVIGIASAHPDQAKPELKEAHSYLGYYYLLKKQPSLSKANWEKVLAIDPNDAAAREGLKMAK